MTDDYDGKYRWLIDRAFALEPGASFKIQRKDGHYDGLFDEKVAALTAASRIRVKMQQYGQAARKKIRVRVATDGSTVEVYRRAK